jgi:hypothetical protein
MSGQAKRLTKAGVRRISEVFFFMILQAAVLFAAAGRLDIPRAWFYFGLQFVYFSVSATIIVRIDPEIVNTRGEAPRGDEGMG